MSFRTTLILALALGGCAQPKAVAPVPAAARRTYPSPRPSTLSIADFAFIGPSTTLDAVVARLGPGIQFAGSGYVALIYPLADGTSITIEAFEDMGWRIASVRHGQEVLFEQAR
jgi:hypothetical protein